MATLTLKRTEPRTGEATRLGTGILIVDNATCVVQPYLPGARGGDSPTLVIQRRASIGGLFAVFDQIFESLW
jgi:hypothetical protein